MKDRSVPFDSSTRAQNARLSITPSGSSILIWITGAIATGQR